jgi:hypothetical protein
MHADMWTMRVESLLAILRNSARVTAKAALLAGLALARTPHPDSKASLQDERINATRSFDIHMSAALDREKGEIHNCPSKRGKPTMPLADWSPFPGRQLAQAEAHTSQTGRQSGTIGAPLS